MKTTSAVIKLKLYTSKTLGNGENPIMISVAWGGQQKYKSTGFSCTPKYWDAKNEMVKRGYPNFIAINEAILGKKNKVIAKRIEFEKSDTVYTSSMLLEDTKDLRGSNLLYKDIQEQYIKENNISWNTSRTYNNAFAILKKHFVRDNFLITEITDDVLKEIFLVENRELKGNTVRTILAKIVAVIGFANKKGLVSYTPTEGYSTIRKFFKKSEHHQCFLESDIQKIYDCYNTQKENLSPQELIAIECWICSFSLFGLAPIDLLFLNTRQTLNKDDVISIDTTRRKTHAPVNIQLKKADHPEATEILEKYMNTAHLRGDYILPCLDGKEKNDIEFSKKVNNFVHRINKGFKKIRQRCEIKSEYSMYSARHTSATMMLRSGLPIDTIASALGRRTAEIGVYLANLTKSQDLQEVSSMLSLTNTISRIKKIS